ncbi:hypothetical protein LEMA_P082530.1 [Plenodomus lingam JN3]|uniref:Zn(2)-C6 fungal-type domain-containing protein n=1 Tax=Leptosphaeria maculans (strain JN3 / isolate v23.1.3 / race Av1-4-5-6-7-8) TaxID=985895 RepID=E5A5W9_LEPMJ|nr:hypothetical protein LEMA_P082530.1 [Plenodomus lingam JN3]CBX99014.1 hypothetical protein LEMA_P082530.1 [Plenodomus lingam JN3]
MDTSERWHPIAPASDEPGKQRPPPDRRKRRQAIAVACIQCRIGKAKCDGTRPRCNRCRDNEVVCQYDVAEGVSRAERMKLLKRDSMTGRMEELERIVNFLRSGSDLQASTVLARLRLGERVEEVAKSLPAASSTSGQSKPPSSLTQESASTPGSAIGFSPDAVNTFNETSGTRSLRHDSNASITSSSGHRPSWQTIQSHASPAFGSPAKGKQTASADDGEDQPFLSILYDRDDILLPISESEDESEDDDDTYQTYDPRLAPQAANLEMGTLSFDSPAESSKGPRPSSHKQNTVRSIYATHLLSRQPIVNTTRVHPNLDIRTLLANVRLPSGAQENYSPELQSLQADNLAIPTWSMLPINTRPDPGSLRYAFPTILEEARNLLSQGVALDVIIEIHPNIAALYDEEEFNRSGILSQWAVRMIGFDQRMRRPPYSNGSPADHTTHSPNQLLMPHVNIVDFVVWPAFRELVVQIPTMQERMEWLMDMFLTLQCDWSFPMEEALMRHEETGLWDLCPLAKGAMRDLSNWSVAASFRGYIGPTNPGPIRIIYYGRTFSAQDAENRASISARLVRK